MRKLISAMRVGLAALVFAHPALSEEILTQESLGFKSAGKVPPYPVVIYETELHRFGKESIVKFLKENYGMKRAVEMYEDFERHTGLNFDLFDRSLEWHYRNEPFEFRIKGETGKVDARMSLTFHF